MRELSILARCHELPACAQKCRQSLGWISEGLSLSDRQSRALCAELKPYAGDDDVLRARARAFALAGLRRAAERVRPRLCSEERDRLDCGLERLEVVSAPSGACERVDMRTFADQLTRTSKWVEAPEDL